MFNPFSLRILAVLLFVHKWFYPFPGILQWNMVDSNQVVFFKTLQSSAKNIWSFPAWHWVSKTGACCTFVVSNRQCCHRRCRRSWGVYCRSAGVSAHCPVRRFQQSSRESTRPNRPRSRCSTAWWKPWNSTWGISRKRFVFGNLQVCFVYPPVVQGSFAQTHKSIWWSRKAEAY